MRNIGVRTIAVLLILSSAPVFGQTVDNEPFRYDSLEFPQWARDVRRFDIVTLGALPFAFFTATFFTDATRWAQHDWEMTYSPWPLKPSGAYETSDDEKLAVLGIAFAIAVGVAVIDLVVINVKRLKTPPLNDSRAVVKRTTSNDTLENAE
ncbi:MAG: hypothetical protein LBE74_08950 [Treponema sp.]|jgi:hypothetical protein|nr:hypothetical protein [Treponema sp.]